MNKKMLAIAATLAWALPATAETLVVGAYPANPPWEFINEQGTYEGFEVDVARAVAERLGMDVTFENLGFQALFAATASGRIDGAVSSISVTPERLENQSFTQPYYDSDGAIVGRADGGIESVEDLSGKTVGVVAATTGAKWAEANAETIGFDGIKSYEKQQDLLMDAANGRVAGGAGEVAGFQYAIQQMPGLEILVRIPTGERFAMMMRKDHELLPQINEAISEMKRDGTMAQIHETWFGVAPEPGTSTVEPMELPSN